MTVQTAKERKTLQGWMKIGQCATLLTIQLAPQASRDADQDRLDEELTQNINATCADRHTQTDFAGTFGDGYVHDIHDTDTTYHQRNSGNAGEQGCHQISGRV